MKYKCNACGNTAVDEHDAWCKFTVVSAKSDIINLSSETNKFLVDKFGEGCVLKNVSTFENKQFLVCNSCNTIGHEIKTIALMTPIDWEEEPENEDATDFRDIQSTVTNDDLSTLINIRSKVIKMCIAAVTPEIPNVDIETVVVSNLDNINPSSYVKETDSISLLSDLYTKTCRPVGWIRAKDFFLNINWANFYYKISTAIASGEGSTELNISEVASFPETYEGEEVENDLH